MPHDQQAAWILVWLLSRASVTGPDVGGESGDETVIKIISSACRSVNVYHWTTFTLHSSPGIFTTLEE